MNAPRHPKERSHFVRLAMGNGLRPDVWTEFQVCVVCVCVGVCVCAGVGVCVCVWCFVCVWGYGCVARRASRVA